MFTEVTKFVEHYLGLCLACALRDTCKLTSTNWDFLLLTVFSSSQINPVNLFVNSALHTRAFEVAVV
jgi:hypothetical protein